MLMGSLHLCIAGRPVKEKRDSLTMIVRHIPRFVLTHLWTVDRLDTCDFLKEIYLEPWR
jgi:hypothetical protein